MEPLTVAGTLDSLTAIRDYVDQAVAQGGLDRRAGYRLRLAVDEIATNIVNYGYDRAQLSGDIRLTATLDDAWVRVSLEDTGIAFDPTAAEPPDDLDDPLEERAIGGLGIFLTLRGVDEFRYQRLGDRNVNIFGMRRAATGQNGEP